MMLQQQCKATTRMVHPGFQIAFWKTAIDKIGLCCISNCRFVKRNWGLIKTNLIVIWWQFEMRRSKGSVRWLQVRSRCCQFFSVDSRWLFALIQIWVVLCYDQNCPQDSYLLLFLPSWLKMSPLKCLLTLTPPLKTRGKVMTMMVVITSRILILTTVITVIATLRFQSVPFPTEHVTSSSQRQVSKRERNVDSLLWQIHRHFGNKSNFAPMTNPALISRSGTCWLAGGWSTTEWMVGAELLLCSVREEHTGAESTGGQTNHSWECHG